MHWEGLVMSKIRSYRSRLLLTAATAAGFSIAAPGWAEITSLTALGSKDIGPFNGKPYREIEARMEGSAPGGPYAVPITLVLPKRAEDHNGFALVDIINTVTIGKPEFVIGGKPLPLARAHMGDEFLFGRGNTYVGVMWDKAATDTLKIGTIAAPADGYTILKDAATLARSPADLLSADVGAAPASSKVIAYGYSQTGSLLRGWYVDHHNTQDGALIFDGGLVAGASGGCRNLQTAEWKVCAGAITDSGKIISLSPESDAEWGGYYERGESPDYRFFEIAGVSHIPATEADFRNLGMPEQNMIDFGPAFRAALVNLEDWLNGRNPPPSASIELAATPTREADGVGVRPAVRDADGNAKGGVRLPHMPTILADGNRAGAPLGSYTGMAWNYEKRNIFFAISGTFTPFPQDKIKALYPDHETYVAAVTAAAQDLAAKRHILPEDADAYVTAAENSNIGR
jgi:Alpha/beta hydrolase domain